MRVIYRKIRHARYLYIKRNVEKVWGARYTLGVRYLSKNTVYSVFCKDPLFINPLNAELNPICHLLALLGAHLILHISRIRVNMVRHLR